MKKVRLRALEPQDIDLIYRWENDPEVWEQSAAHTPFSRHALTQYIMDSMQSDILASRQLRLMAEDADNGITVGCIDLTSYDPMHQRAETGLIIDRQYRNMGYGEALMEALLKYGRESLFLHQIYCEVAIDNIASIKLFEHCGFERQGLRKDWIMTREGWKDVLLMAKIIS